jgi:hypothetical protein
MKKIYTTILILLVSYTINAQTDPDLFGQWFLHYIELNGNIINVPTGSTVDINFYTVTDPNYVLLEGNSTCNSFSANYVVNNSNSSVDIIIQAVTLAMCNGDTFDPTYLGIISDDTNNFYDYIIDLQAETLTMIDLLGTKLVYGRQVLSTEDTKTLSNSLKLFPNPAKNEVFVADFSIDSKTTYSIYNMTGSVIANEKPLKQNSIRISSLKAGVYFLRITQKGKTYLKKFIKG